MRTKKVANKDKREKEIIKLAAYVGPWENGSVEMGDPADLSAMVSEGEDNGAYVRAWVWISFEGTALDKDGK